MNWKSVWEWAKDPERKSAALAFTSGDERQAADVAEYVANRMREECAKVADKHDCTTPGFASDCAAQVAHEIRLIGTNHV